MATFLLTWNPLKWDWTSLDEVINQFKNMEVVMIKEMDLLPEGDIDVISLN